MPTYYDSSALLEVLLGGDGAGSIVECWAADAVRMSSILLEAECLTVLRRAERQGPGGGESPGMDERVAALGNYAEALIVREVDRDVLDLLGELEVLSECRSLDALHLATASLFQRYLDEPLRLCALDGRMRRLGAILGFEVVPANRPRNGEQSDSG